MKLRFLILEGKAPAWIVEARQQYHEKISFFLPFEIRVLKSPSADRDSATVKQRLEAELILKELDEKDLLVLFDEKGKMPRTSEDFAQSLTRVLESGKSSVVFCIGGPYGFSDVIKKRSQMQWSLSPLTMNHWIAGIVAMEQLYRGLTIIKGIPYHNR